MDSCAPTIIKSSPRTHSHLEIHQQPEPEVEETPASQSRQLAMNELLPASGEQRSVASPGSTGAATAWIQGDGTNGPSPKPVNGGECSETGSELSPAGGLLLLGDSSRPGYSLFEKKSPRDEQQRERESKQALKLVMKLQNEIVQINNSVLSQEGAYKSSLFSNKYMGNIFSSFSPFVVGINRLTLRPRERSPEEVLKSIRKKADGSQGRCEYAKYSTQWYLWAKRRNAEILSQTHTIGGSEQQSSSAAGAVSLGTAGSASTSCGANLAGQNNIGQIVHSNQLLAQKEIQNVEQSVKFRLALQPDRPLFPFGSGVRPDQTRAQDAGGI